MKNNYSRKTKYGFSPYNPPCTLMTKDDYHTRLTTLGKNRDLTVGDEEFFSDLETLRNDLYDTIAYNTTEIAVTGNKYYISTDGDDDNDGLSPETAWQTLKKATEYTLNPGDGVYLRRGDLWRGNLPLQSGVTYQAYGEGPKPKILNSINGKSKTLWIESGMPNIWIYDKVLDSTDIGVITFNDGEKYAEKKMCKSDLKNELDFFYSGYWTYYPEERNEYKIYLYCSQGNPNDIFEEIEFSICGHTIPIENYQHDIAVHNLDIRYGQDYFFNDSTKNIKLSYCFLSWMGGHYGAHADINNGCYRFGGGGGAWRNCDLMQFDHCFFTQHFDCAMSPQFTRDIKENPNYYERTAANFKDFKVQNCLIEYCEYSFEYFFTQYQDSDVEGQPCYDGLYFGYNICRKCEQGFGDKHSAAKFIRAGDHENYCINSVFERNIFDRSGQVAIEISGYEGDQRRNIVSYEHLPKMRENIYIDPKNKHFAIINQILYDFNNYSKAAIEKLGVEKNSIFVYTPEK